jgi:hypothetical protein
MYLCVQLVLSPHFATLSLEHDFKQSLHGLDVELEVHKLLLEHGDHMIKHPIEVGSPLGNQLATSFNVLSNRRKDKFRIN